MALERETVLRTALRLLDEVGLDGLSLRRLAKELGVQAPALYWHFTNKQDLLDHLVAFAREEAGVSFEPPPAGQPWDRWLADGMRAQRRALLAHRDGARLGAGNRPPPEAWPHVERALSVLVEAGFTPEDALRAVIVLGHYVVGFVLDEQKDLERQGDAGIEFDLERFPVIAAAGPAALDRDATFEYGLQRMLDGMRAHVTAARETRPGHEDPPPAADGEDRPRRPSATDQAED
ncbi:TetR/AcrR family transcriptional regulator C-terminal domain-containing protein [Actinoallomurus rhizosphaericola]|uniref:TetR/AcrR family transcriptional regulator C-terminal domain-containing protein n=1 Tax=Actinoallomurus rhizosphaericola TaxID=2952536 RepID=UPI0020924D2D|nr:TetR/AcrR family transcriptional regulator C-terminal domain-containing protein [Actinoallomurus rhizosphaericola]MCO5995068.1 TetR/AcrR family transcriptional regulator C-terminal domain-containing protein [Actinoallomurus rhizosphaericola]